ncbi:MAG: hypothetical protein E6J61_16140 [Deltaproteobacteria bacterium]|nr:MAG: hypothetical protein E6J61_16140 [Deltaproteobacteria bacterium]
MIPLALLLSTAPFAAHFWARDLGALARDIAESREDAEVPFFRDLLRLCSCEPLGPAEGNDPLRALLRVEEARRVRLGARAASSPTIWREVMRPDFFRRDPGNPPGDDALEWPDEEERWTGERLLVAAPESACDAAVPSRKQSADSPAAREVPPGLAVALAAAGHAGTASVLAYHEATLLWRANKMSEAAFVARTVDPGRLGPLSRWASLLRIATGVDARASAVALARDWQGEGSALVRVLAIDALARQGRWDETVAASEQLPDAPRSRLLFHARLLRARALFETGRAAAARTVLPRDREDAVRDLAIEVLAADSLDAAGVEMVGSLFPDTTEALLRIARRALVAGSIPVARSAAARLDPAEPRTLALKAELAFAANAPEVGPALETALSGPLPRGMRRSTRERAVVELCHSLVELAARASARLRADTAALLAGAREDLGSSTQKAVDSAVAALRADGAAAIGVVRVGSTLPLPELPPIQVDWPEPASLLAIPDGDGGFRDWFPEAKTVAGGPRT